MALACRPGARRPAGCPPGSGCKASVVGEQCDSCAARHVIAGAFVSVGCVCSFRRRKKRVSDVGTNDAHYGRNTYVSESALLVAAKLRALRTIEGK